MGAILNAPLLNAAATLDFTFHSTAGRRFLGFCFDCDECTTFCLCQCWINWRLWNNVRLTPRLRWKRTTKPWPKTKAERLCIDYTLVTVGFTWSLLHPLMSVPHVSHSWCEFTVNTNTQDEKSSNGWILDELLGDGGVAVDPPWSAHRNCARMNHGWTHMKPK